MADMIAEICKIGPLAYPGVFQCNNRSEYKAEVIEAWSVNTMHYDKV